MSVSAPSSALSAAHQQLQDAVAFDDDARTELKELEKRYRASQAKAKKGQEGVSAALQRLDKTHVTFIGLTKTSAGVTVNKLRKHDVASIANDADKLVRRWKSLVEQHQARSLPMQRPPTQQPTSSSAVARSTAAAPSRGTVLDAVRDEHGRVERRVAHPDSQEDQLALDEAAEAERMWEEQMGSGSGSGRGCSAGSSSSREPPPLCRTRSQDEKLQRLQEAGHMLKDMYRDIEASKKSRQAVLLEPNQMPKRKGAPAAPGGWPGRPAAFQKTHTI